MERPVGSVGGRTRQGTRASYCGHRSRDDRDLLPGRPCHEASSRRHRTAHREQWHAHEQQEAGDQPESRVLDGPERRAERLLGLDRRAREQRAEHDPDPRLML